MNFLKAIRPMKRGDNKPFTPFTESREITLQFIHFVTKGLITPLPHGEITFFGRKLPGGVYLERFAEKKVNTN